MPTYSEIEIGTNVLLVIDDIPKAAHSFIIDDELFYKLDNSERSYMRSLPPGSWELLGVAKDLSEEQWKGLVEYELIEGEDEKYWNDYQPNGKVRANLFLDTATESGHSFLRANKIGMNDVLLVRK